MSPPSAAKQVLVACIFGLAVLCSQMLSIFHGACNIKKHFYAPWVKLFFHTATFRYVSCAVS